MPCVAVTFAILAAPALALSSDWQGQKSILARLDATRTVEADRLIHYATANMRSVHGAGPATTAILLLGRMRADAAIPFLVDNLTFDGDRAAAAGIRPFDQVYPCVTALGAIGGPAVNRVVASAEASDDGQRHALTAHVLVRALGPELAADYLNRRFAALPAGDRRTRVAGVIKWLPTANIYAEARGRNTGQHKDRPLFDPPDPVPAKRP